MSHSEMVRGRLLPLYPPASPFSSSGESVEEGEDLWRWTQADPGSNPTLAIEQISGLPGEH